MWGSANLYFRGGWPFYAVPLFNCLGIAIYQGSFLFIICLISQQLSVQVILWLFELGLIWLPLWLDFSILGQFKSALVATYSNELFCSGYNYKFYMFNLLGFYHPFHFCRNRLLFKCNRIFIMNKLLSSFSL